jgi:hypothetical protein
MKLLILVLFWSFGLFAYDCDCEVFVYSPMTGPHLPPKIFERYEINEFPRMTSNSQNLCRVGCLKKFEEELPARKLNELLQGYSQELIQGNVLGYNCTGLTTLKYPVRVKASLGGQGLGNVVDQIHVVTHEEVCF